MIDNIELEQVNSFKCVGSVLNKDYRVEEEIQERIAVGNKVFYKNKKMIFSKLLTRHSKMCSNKSLLKPAVMYECKMWVLRDIYEQQLRAFERKVTRKIYSPIKNQDGTEE